MPNRNSAAAKVENTRAFLPIVSPYTITGFIAAVNSDNGLGEVINLGSNFEVSIGETAQLIADYMGVSLNIITDEVRKRPENSEVERLWADNTKAKNLLDWEPSYGGLSGFKKGLGETIDWFTQPKNLLQYKSDMFNL